MACQIVQKKQEEKQLEEEQAAKAQNCKLPVCYDDDDDEERSNSLKDNIISGLPPCSAITPNEPVLSTEEPNYSLTSNDNPTLFYDPIVSGTPPTLTLFGESDFFLEEEKLQQLEQWANLSTYPSKRFNWFCYDDDDDEDFTIAVTPSLLTEKPDNSLSMGDEHLDTILATESDEVIKSSVENLIPILSESEGIPDNMCDVPFHDNSSPLDVSKDQFEDFSDSNDEFSLIDDDFFSIDSIDYVKASPTDSELVSSEVMEIVIPKVRGINDDILLTIKDDILREKLLDANLLFAKIEALNDNPTPFYDPIVSATSLTLTLFGESNFFLEEVDAFFAVEDEPTSS
nr:hypothetical protein [Tanacetum cinerariifolium]